MILNNTQANIFKVNGGIADNFANRPAANGSFYIFYSIDTQQIFYDNGAWVLIGSGGGGGVNIYNSDGTLTGNRTLSGANNILTFEDLSVFQTSILGNAVGLYLDFQNSNFYLGELTNNNYTQLIISDSQSFIKTQYQTNDIGLKLDFANNNYQFGDGNSYYLSIDATNQNVSLNCNNTAFSLFADNINKYISIGQSSDQVGFTFYNDFTNGIFVSKMGDPLGLINECTFQVDSLNQIIKTTNQNNDIGLKLDFANNEYYLGDYSYTNGSSFIELKNTYALIFGGNANQTKLNIDDGNSNIVASYQGNDVGLKLDFANTTYKFGQITGGGETTFNINDTTQTINLTQFYAPTSTPNVINGIDFNLQSEIYKFGAINGGYANHHLISDSQNYWFYTRLFGANRGFFFQVSNAARSYSFGELNGNNRTSFTINDVLETTTFFHNGVQKGLKLDYAQRRYQFGQLSANSLTSFNIEDNGGFIYCLYQNNGIGFSFQGNVSIYQYGQISGGNQTRLTIADAATYPVQLDGTNVLSGTSGGSSAQHLKIKINGVDYKIRLENP